MVAIRRVVGESMLPTLRPDQVVVIRRKVRLQVSDVVMVRHGGLDKIKRVSAIQDGKIFVEGDNPAASTDSRQFGWIDRQSVQGKVIWPRKLQKNLSRK